MKQIFFDNWETIYRTIIVAPLAYIGLIVFLRLSGNRTLSKMNAFDFIVTVALGSTLATILLNKDVSLAEGLLALLLLISLQFLVTYTSVRFKAVRRTVTGEPSIIFYKGQFLQDRLKSARVTIDEVEAAIRSNGQLDMTGILAVVLETNGQLSVIPEQGDDRPEPFRSRTTLSELLKRQETTSSLTQESDRHAES